MIVGEEGMQRAFENNKQTLVLCMVRAGALLFLSFFVFNEEIMKCFKEP